MTREQSTGTSDDQAVQAFARLTVHEFMLEILMANWLADMPEGQSQEAIATLGNRFRRAEAAAPPSLDNQSIDRWMLDVQELQAHFLAKVSRRCSEIRAARLQEADDQ